MRWLKSSLFCGALALMACASPARANNVIGLTGVLNPDAEYVFGFSGATNGSLQLTLSGGGTATLSTNGSQGWWSGVDGNVAGNTNYFTGDLSNNGTELLNSYFTFDVSSLAGQSVTGATLVLEKDEAHSDTGRATQTYSLFDVSTDAATLNAIENGPNQSIFDDLGSGTSYGSFGITVANGNIDSTLLSFALNGSGLADLNAAISGGATNFSIGGTLTPLGPSPTPEPASMALLGLGALGLMGYGWRRRRSEKQ